jgi:hypothetical protein
MDVSGKLGFADERSGRSGVNWYIDADEIAHDECVVRGAAERGIARNRGDPDQFGVSGGDHDGNGVVVAGIAVEEDRRAIPGGGSLRHDAEHGIRTAPPAACADGRCWAGS